MARTFGKTKDCNGCRFWSEMIAVADERGVEAMCMSPDGPAKQHYVPGDWTCDAWKSGHHGAIDQPPDYGEETRALYAAEEALTPNTNGQPLPYYQKNEFDWPPVWRMPNDYAEGGDLAVKISGLTDDVLLREAIHIWDNAWRIPGSFEAIIVGMMGAMARLFVGRASPLKGEPEVLAREFLAPFTGMFEQALRIQREGWDSLREKAPDADPPGA